MIPFRKPYVKGVGGTKLPVQHDPTWYGMSLRLLWLQLVSRHNGAEPGLAIS